jgi:hypothetical protein
MSRPLTTTGGTATTDEMCLSYLSYYPRMNLTDCQSVVTTTPLLTSFATYLIAGNHNDAFFLRFLFFTALALNLVYSTTVTGGMNQTKLTYYFTQALLGTMTYGEAFYAAGKLLITLILHMLINFGSDSCFSCGGVGVVWNPTQIAWWNAAVAANPQKGVCVCLSVHCTDHPLFIVYLMYHSIVMLKVKLV